MSLIWNCQQARLRYLARASCPPTDLACYVEALVVFNPQKLSFKVQYDYRSGSTPTATIFKYVSLYSAYYSYLRAVDIHSNEKINILLDLAQLSILEYDSALIESNILISQETIDAHNRHL